MGAILVGLAATASAGPGFIESSRVSGDAATDAFSASIEVRFNCKAEYVRHEPQGSSDRLRVYLDPTGICNGVSPIVAESRSRLRPVNSDNANLTDLEYDGDSPAGPMLTFNFGRPVAFDVDMSGVSFGLIVTVSAADDLAAQTMPAPIPPSVPHRQVPRATEDDPNYVINLASFRRIPTIADATGLELDSDQHLYYSEVIVDGKSWYRLRLGNFESGDAAAVALGDLKVNFPGAWIDEIDKDASIVEIGVAEQSIAEEPIDMPDGDGMARSKVDELMDDARKSMAAGEISRAIQIYTKVLQQPEHTRMAEAQEYLALAREKNGQMAHAKAEYQRYLSLYPDTEGAARVNQRLSALLASNRQSAGVLNTATLGRQVSRQNDWRVQSYFSQYYRRDVNQQSDQDEIVSQSALYSDVNLDARRRGERFDFSSRLSAGYRSDFLNESFGSGNSLRISYAYADLADATTGFRGRIGRQSRNSGGVLGRFDGLNLGYQLDDRVQLNTVIGKPAYSSSDGIDSSRTFYGVSAHYGPILENLDLGAFYIAQDVEGVQDRQAVGAEFRYFGTNQSLWGMVDYDIAYRELANAFLQGSWRFESHLSIHGLVDRRGSPFLSASNALIGQPVLTFKELAQIYSEDELRQLGRDRTSLSTTFTIGLSYPISPRLQINADASQSTMDATPASGGVFATEESTYKYYSGSLVASSILKEGDVSIISARFSDSDTSRVISLTFDSRYPIGRTWRINPRLRVDRRQRLADPNYEWLYTPGIRLQYRRSQRFRITLEAGKQYSQRDTGIADLNLDRESYFFNIGYQSFF